VGDKEVKKRVRVRRDELRAADPRCHWCGVVTTPPRSGVAEATMATLDHLIPKTHPRRRLRTADRTLKRTVLSCFRCNNERGKKQDPNHGRYAKRNVAARRIAYA
jgi:hypothetical protein